MCCGVRVKKRDKSGPVHGAGPGVAASTPAWRPPLSVSEACIQLAAASGRPGPPLCSVMPVMPASSDSDSLQRVWQRLAARVGLSAERGRPLVTVLRQDWQTQPLLGGGRVLVLDSSPSLLRRRGQAKRLRVVDLAAGAHCRLPVLTGLVWECLVLAGDVVLDGQLMGCLDYHREPATAADLPVWSASGARLLLRESRPAAADTRRASQPAQRSSWEQLAGGINRRQLAAMGDKRISLQRLAPGSGLPPHHHTQDEECLLLEGEMHVEDRLLRAGDYQLAPAGTWHRRVVSESGVLLYRHGDAELDDALTEAS
jgi:quercetin dioxygenase-like cupin family protein